MGYTFHIKFTSVDYIHQNYFLKIYHKIIQLILFIRIFVTEDCMKRSIKFEYKSEQLQFRAYVELLQPILKLRDRECDVFAELLYFNYLKRDIKNLKDRFEIIFSVNTKRLIISNLGIKDSILQNTLSILRKKNLIIDNTIPEKFHIYPTDNTIELTFKLVTNDR